MVVEWFQSTKRLESTVPAWWRDSNSFASSTAPQYRGRCPMAKLFAFNTLLLYSGKSMESLFGWGKTSIKSRSMLLFQHASKKFKILIDGMEIFNLGDRSSFRIIYKLFLASTLGTPLFQTLTGRLGTSSEFLIDDRSFSVSNTDIDYIKLWKASFCIELKRIWTVPSREWASHYLMRTWCASPSPNWEWVWTWRWNRASLAAQIAHTPM